MAEVNLTLTENADDFLLEAVRYARASSARDWKYAVVHLCSAAELLLKALLEKRGHWSLLFQDVDNASFQKLLEGDFKSVDFETALERVRNIVGIEIAPKDLKYLKRLRRLRNRANHFAVRFNVEQAKSLVARGISVFLTLQQKYLQQAPDKTLEYQINQALAEFEKYVGERLRALRAELERAERPPDAFQTCRSCTQDALVTLDAEAACLFCGARMEFDDLAGYSDGVGGPCPECEVGVLAFELFNNDDGHFVCVRCGFKASRSFNCECSRCGRTFWNEEGQAMCDGCLSH